MFPKFPLGLHVFELKHAKFIKEIQIGPDWHSISGPRDPMNETSVITSQRQWSWGSRVGKVSPSWRLALLWKGPAMGPREFWFENHRKCFFHLSKKIQSFYNMTTRAYARFALITYFCIERQITHSVEWKGTCAFLCVWKYLQETCIGNCSLFSMPGQCSRVESLRCAFWCCLIKELAISNVILKGERSSGWGLALNLAKIYICILQPDWKTSEKSFTVILKLSLFHRQMWLL